MENKIIDYVCNYNIIGIGETTHGQKKINILRFNIIKNLLKINKTKNLYLFIEDQYSSCKFLNYYIHNKKTNLKKYFNKLMPPIYKNVYFYKFLNLCKNYNLYSKYNKIFLYGIDMRFYYHKPKDSIDNYIYDLYKRVQKDYKNRDYFMFKIFTKIFNSNSNKYNDTYFHISHNGHINYFNIFGKPSLGKLLKMNNYNYVAIYTAFNGGSYTAFNERLKTFQIISIYKKTSFNKQGFYILNKYQNKKYIVYEGGFLGDKDNPYKEYWKRIINYKQTNAVIIFSKEEPLKIFNI